MKTKEELQLELDNIKELFEQKFEEFYKSQEFGFNEQLYNEVNLLKQQVINKEQELYS